MPEGDVGYDLQDGPKDVQNGHDGQGQRYGHLQQPSRNAQRGRLEVVPHVSTTDLSHHNSSYCFLGGVVLGHNVQDPTDYELQEETGNIPSGNG